MAAEADMADSINVSLNNTIHSSSSSRDDQQILFVMTEAAEALADNDDSINANDSVSLKKATVGEDFDVCQCPIITTTITIILFY